ncbi:MAG: hypothetical protein ACP5T3_03175, partial [Candidatus Micrarchaeia archaeon]
MLAILLSFGAVNALIPIMVIIILIAAAAGLTRGYNLFEIFGIGAIAGLGSAAKKGSIIGRSPYGSVANTAGKYTKSPARGITLKRKNKQPKEAATNAAQFDVNGNGKPELPGNGGSTQGLKSKKTGKTVRLVMNSAFKGFVNNRVVNRYVLGNKPKKPLNPEDSTQGLKSKKTGKTVRLVM